ncbi:MAG: ComF family protein [Ruminiclostridium sp.]|nr:ComF family protein [Ruminiclostridium sp.]
MKLHNIYRFFINIIYPNICPCCETIIEYDGDFCDKCRNKILPYDSDFIIKHVDEFTAYCYYEGIIRHAIRKYKITAKGNSYYAFAFSIAQTLRRKRLTNGLDGIVYIPMTKAAQNERGYNQVKLMAKELHSLLDIPVYDALVKIRNTKSQKSVSAEARRSNLKNAFAISDKVDIKGKRLLLIDDVCTTGNTISEAARILKEAGADMVIAASFAKTRDIHSKNLTN